MVRHAHTVLIDSADHTVSDIDDVVLLMAKYAWFNTMQLGTAQGTKWMPTSPGIKATVLGGKVAGHLASRSTTAFLAHHAAHSV